MAARKNKVKDFIAPMIFSGSLNAEGFEGWLEFHLLPSLKEPQMLNASSTSTKNRYNNPMEG